MFSVQLFKTIRLIIILAFVLVVVYHLTTFDDGAQIVYRIPVEKQDAAARYYHEVYEKERGSNFAASRASEATLKIFGEPIVVQTGEFKEDPLSFIKVEKKPQSRLQK